MFSKSDDEPWGVLGLIAFIVVAVAALAIGVGIHRSSGRTATSAPAAQAAVPAQDAASSPASAAAAATEAVSPASATVVAAIAPVAEASAVLPSPAATAVLPADANGASVQVEGGVVRFYFAPGKAELPAGTANALTGVVQAAKSGSRLAIAGFHDSTGTPGRNAHLALQRAKGVYEALLATGVPAAQMELKKPALLSGSASATGGQGDAQARRVEITLQ